MTGVRVLVAGGARLRPVPRRWTWLTAQAALALLVNHPLYSGW
ncbi:hypothetical protein [Streptomyces sp. NPDC048612]